jgi:hypothetical protein
MTTWSPSDKGTGVVLSNANLTASFTDFANKSVRSTTPKTSGKWYFETVALWTETTISGRYVGIMTVAGDIESDPGDTNQGYAFFYDPGGSNVWYVRFNDIPTSIGGTASNGDIIGICLDLSANKLYVTRNGVNLYGNPVAGTGGASIAAGTWFAAAGGASSATTPQTTANFGATTFSFGPPTGYFAWDGSAVTIGVSTVGAAITRKFRVVGV